MESMMQLGMAKKRLKEFEDALEADRTRQSLRLRELEGEVRDALSAVKQERMGQMVPWRREPPTLEEVRMHAEEHPYHPTERIRRGLWQVRSQAEPTEEGYTPGWWYRMAQVYVTRTGEVRAYIGDSAFRLPLDLLLRYEWRPLAGGLDEDGGPCPWPLVEVEAVEAVVEGT